MNLGFVIYSVGKLLQLLGAVMLVPFTIAIFEMDSVSFAAFLTDIKISGLLWGVFLSLICGTALTLIPHRGLKGNTVREGFAIVTVPNAQAGEFKTIIDELVPQIKAELDVTEPDLTVNVTETDMPSQVIDEKTSNNLIKAIYGFPNGVIRMSDAMEGLVETSTNLAVVKMQDSFVELASLQRSSVESAKEDLANMIRCVLELAGAEVVHEGAYPGWKPNIDSPILKTMQDAYNNKWGKVPELKAIHAGLECGIIMENYPNLDTISFGPTIRYPHSPDEKVNIETVQKFYDFLLETLKNIPKK